MTVSPGDRRGLLGKPRRSPLETVVVSPRLWFHDDLARRMAVVVAMAI
ncbi:hypothetical protein TIFTF001_026179 [Ficus carica]|uniref:Uncharacterized protein n=1 Tax=Ficus carica TaxID=3494 RepID=A0AA88DKR4_FICCA|nr:hypothetical protein TIFTF001_026179 [Ficus carica]